MSKKLYEESNIQAIADAIREKNGTQNQYTVSQMPSAVRAIETQPVLETLIATENGNYVPSTGKDGFSSVTVNVEGEEAVIQPLNATQNGTYNPPSGVDGFAPVTVNVSGGGGETNFLYGSDAPSSDQGNNGDIFLQVVSSMNAVLPSGYQELPAIEGTGSQYIDTSISTAQARLSVKARLALTGISSSSSSGGDGIWGGSWAANGYLMIRFGGSPGVLRWHYGNARPRDVPVTLNKWILLETNNTGMIIDGVTYPLTGGGTNTENTLSLFYVGSHTIGVPSLMRLSRTKVSVDDTVLADFVPCKNSNNEIGMYDIVGQSFYGNAGQGSFLAVTENEIIASFLKVNGTWQDLLGSNIDDVNK